MFHLTHKKSSSGNEGLSVLLYYLLYLADPIILGFASN